MSVKLGLSLNKEQMLRAFENNVLRRTGYLELNEMSKFRND
jgi:hypothetical protein